MSNIPEESIIGGQPAKLIKTGYRKVESATTQTMIWSYFRQHPEADFFPLSEDISHSICDVDENESSK